MDKANRTNDCLSYSIAPNELTTPLLPAMWGNGQLELFANLDRPCVSEVVCFGFGKEALWYGPGVDPRARVRGGEQHLLPAVYDADTGRKYLLYARESSGARSSIVNFKPDRQIWRYEFDDLTIDISLLLPRVRPGYLFKLELIPGDNNTSRRWFVYHELRAFQGNLMQATEADYELASGTVWWKSHKSGHPEAIGSSCDAETINLGQDGPWATNIMAQVVVERDGQGEPVIAYFARAFGDTLQCARDGLAEMLATPEKLETETEAWWKQYLDEVPCLDAPDETFCETFLWSWANFRMNRIDVPIGKCPAGICPSNNVSLKLGPVASADNQLQEALQLWHDPLPARDMMLYWLRETRKSGLISPGLRHGVDSILGNYVSDTAWFCGLLHKYLLATGDLALLDEDVGGKSVLQRLEEAVEAQLPFCDKQTGLIPHAAEHSRFEGETPTGKPSGLGALSEAQTRFRGGAGAFYSDTSATVYGGLLALAEIEGLAQNSEHSDRYRQLAEAMHAAIQKHLWNEDLGFFCDLRPDGSCSDYVGKDGFITGLFANPVHRPGGVATKAQAEKLAEWCNHPDFVSEFGVLSLARSSPYFDPMNWKGRNSGFNFYPTNQIPAGLYAHGCYEEGHRQLFKQFRRHGENGGLGPRYRGESNDGDTGEILPWRFNNYPSNLHALTSVVEGVFGIRLINDALTVHVNSPWPWAKLSNLRIRQSLLDLELTEDGKLIATINGEEAARSDDGKLVLPWELFA